MSLFKKLIESIDSFGFYALSFAIVIMIIVFVHEIGHYFFARIFGVHAEIFSLGIGKKIIGFRDKRGTFWQIAAIPLGGYLKMRGEEGASFEDTKDLLNSDGVKKMQLIRVRTTQILKVKIVFKKC